MNLNVYENDIDASLITYNPDNTVTISSRPEMSEYYGDENMTTRLQNCLFASNRQFMVGDQFFAFRGETKDTISGKLTPNGNSVIEFQRRVVTRISPYFDFYNQMSTFEERDRFSADAKELNKQIADLTLLFRSQGLPFTLPNAGEYIKKHDLYKGNPHRISELAKSYAKAVHNSVEANLSVVKQYGIHYVNFHDFKANNK